MVYQAAFPCRFTKDVQLGFLDCLVEWGMIEVFGVKQCKTEVIG